MERRSFDLCQGDLVGHGELLFFFNLFQGIFNDGIVFQDFESFINTFGKRWQNRGFFWQWTGHVSS